MKKKLFINAIVIALLGLILTSCSSTVEVKFIGSNGEVISVENVDKNSTITEPSDPKVNGYTFDGWYSDLSCTTEYDFSAAIDKETSVYAKLTPIQYNITYVLDGGVASDNMVSTYNIETKVDLGVPTKANFVFVGWYTSATEGTKVNSITKGNIGDITLYARWNQDIYVTSILLPNSFVSFNQNSGERDQERVEFFDLNKTYKVGDDNNFKFIPEVEFSSYDSENDEFTPAVVEQWTYQLSLFEKDGENFVAVNNESYVDSFNVVTCEVNFNENSVGKTLKVVVTPDGLTAKQKTSIENWQVSFVVEVVDGYNIYVAKEFAYVENRTSGQEATAWAAFKQANGIDINVNPSAVVLHNNLIFESTDVPSFFFYQENELSPLDSDYERTVGSMKDRYDLYSRVLGENETFNMYGNYFTLNMTKFREVTRESGEIKPEGTVVSHATFLRLNGANSGKATFNDCYIVGNAPKVQDKVKAGGQIFNKTQNIEVEFNNLISSCFFITFFPEYYTEALGTGYTVNKCKAYDAFNSFVYNYGSVSLLIKDSEMIGAGGPVIIQDHVGLGTNEEKIAKTKIENSNLHSYVIGNEGWFTVMGANAAVGAIKSLDAFFQPFGKSILKNGSDGTTTYMDFIVVNKSAEAQTITSTKVDGSVQFDDHSAFDFGATNPVIKAFYESAFSLGAPFVQSSECVAGDGCGMVVITPEMQVIVDANSQPVVNPTNKLYQGDYLCIYYSGMALVFGYGSVGDTYN